jgi:hypothetical protein
VWGFTSPLQTLLLGGLSAMGIDTVWAACLVGLLAVASASALLYRLACQALPRALALMLALFFLLDPSLHGVYAMESNVLVALQLGVLLVVTAGRGRLANVLAALSCLTRPDSLLLVVPVLLLDRESRRPRHLAWFLGIGLLWEGFAYAYYHALVPNSLHAKSGLSHFRDFLVHAVRTATDTPWAGAKTQASMGTRIALVAASLLSLLNPRLRRRTWVWSLLLYPWALLVSYAAIGSYKGHDWELYSAVFFFRVAAGIGLLGLVAVVAERVRLRPSWRWTGVAVALSLIVGYGCSSASALVAELDGTNTPYWARSRYETYRRIAEFANRNVPEGATVAISEVGTFGYFTDLHIIDVSGIITRGYAPSERMNHRAFLLRYRPSYAILYGRREDFMLGPGLRYRRIAYFSKQGFEDFSLVIRAPE